MSKRLSYERYLWFHQRLKKKAYPRLKDLMEKFELSQRQAAREIEYMRLYFNAPVKYSTIHKGYFYANDSFELPASMIKEEEIISLVIAQRLSVSIPDHHRKQHLQSFFNNLSNFYDLDITNLAKKISLKNVRYSKVVPKIFDAILQGLSQEKKLNINYHSVHTQKVTQRIISPLHLVLYMGNWHIIAFCQLRQALRDFALSRIKNIQILDENIDPENKAIDIKKEIDDVHGIFFGGKKERIRLKFNKQISDYVHEQVWFPGQKLIKEKTGEVILSFYVTDFREVVREVLSFGANVEVLEPLELKKIITTTLKELNQLYQ